MPTALIVGASRGLGREWARQYLEAGWRVLATCRTEAHRVELRDAGAEALVVDVLDANQVAGLAWQLEDESFDVVVLNFGRFGDRRRLPTDPPSAEDFDLVMQTNVLGAMRLIPIVAPALRRSHGTLAIMSSRMGSVSEPPGTWGMMYRASKAALNMVARIAHAQFAREGVRVLTFNPGWVKTEMGGREAELTAHDSVLGMRRVIDDRQRWPGGRFINHQGVDVPW